jgi:hypothetical protein
VSTYGVTKYAGGLYGVAENTTTLIWVLQVAWAGRYNGDNEAMRMVNCTVRRGRREWVSDSGFNPFDEGEAICIVRNDDNRYWALNTSSPLYPYVRPGPYVRLSVVNGRGGTEYSAMRGYVDDIQCYTQNGHQYARVVVKDGINWLKDQTASIDYAAGLEAPDLIVDVLTAADWPFTEWADGATGAAGVNTIKYYWARNVNAWDECQNLASARPNVIYQARDGSLTFRPHLYTHSATLTLTEGLMLTDVTLAQPWDSLRNQATVNCYTPRVQSVTATLWSQPQPVFIAETAIIRFPTKFVWGDYTKIAGTTTLTWHVHAFVNANGTGTDLTTGMIVEAGPGDAWVEITNDSGADGYITTLEANASFDVVIAPEDPFQSLAEDAASQALYSIKPVTWDTPWMQEQIDAQYIADWLVTELSGLQVEPEVQIEARTATQFGADLYETRVALTLLDIDDYFRIGHITHEWLNDNGQAVRTTFKLEPYLTAWSQPISGQEA